ncbi:hypothetical protein [Polluticoccus soli]|uniref:hypothetical protein n=1 Tax=Polluticoccus soli TaxID=3034150 RepID=UPI0023E15041|nr:hypothetical protein [Flavipsychrobacter sp. JY13-12]
MKQLFFLVFLLAFSMAATAQHEHHMQQPPKKAAPAPKPAATKKPAKKATPAKAATTKKPAKKAAATAPQKAVAPKATPTQQHDHSMHMQPAAKPATDHSMHMQQPVDTTPTHDHSEHMHAADTTMQHDMEEHDHTTHKGHEMNMEADSSMQHDMGGMHGDHDMSSMSHAYSLNLPMNRNGSGTGWLPDESPMYGKMYHTKKWMFMLHGNVFVRYVKTDLFDNGTRGDSKFDAPNWFMAMGQRKVGKRGLFHFSTMFSLDAPIVGGEGYPLLFQSGETWKGKPLIDRQHPHDLFSELAVSYAHAFSKKVDAFVYVGYPGEPALGSVAFMHRPSAMPNPDAPISHHWNDATHITFGVATLGVRVGKFKLEGSSFTGREPDEDRYNFDKPRFDSWSGRLSFNPSNNWAFHVGHGFVKEPETTHPGQDVNRTTASATYSNVVRGNLLNVTALWGLNKKTQLDGENAALLEASYAVNRLNVYTRYEWIQKSAEELGLEEPNFDHHDIFPVNALTLGLAYDLFHLGVIRIAAGTQASLYIAPEKLDPIYGNNPMSGQVYLRLYPTLMR